MKIVKVKVEDIIAHHLYLIFDDNNSCIMFDDGTDWEGGSIEKWYFNSISEIVEYYQTSKYFPSSSSKKMNYIDDHINEFYSFDNFEIVLELNHLKELSKFFPEYFI